MTKWFPVLALAAGLCVPAIGSAKAAESGAFNGTWSVQLVTESGLCSASYTYSVSIREGQMHLASAADAGTRVSGRVGPDGMVGLNVSNGSASGVAAGRLQAQGGSGTWKVSSLCTGRWTARRQNTRTAQAE